MQGPTPPASPGLGSLGAPASPSSAGSDSDTEEEPDILFMSTNGNTAFMRRVTYAYTKNVDPDMGLAPFI